MVNLSSTYFEQVILHHQEEFCTSIRIMSATRPLLRCMVKYCKLLVQNSWRWRNTWYSCFRTSWYNYTKRTNRMQLCRIIYYSLAALHVSRDIFAHHQEHLNCIPASGITHVCRCRLVSWEYRNCFRFVPFILMFIYLWINCLSLHVLLNQIAIVVLYSFRLMFLYVCIPLACLAFINLIFMFPCIMI
jgi:hypothetical protein